MLTHPLLNNKICCVVKCNEMIQRLSSFPYMLLPILPLVKVGGETKSVLFIHFSHDMQWVISCVLYKKMVWKMKGADCDCLGRAVGLKSGLRLCHANAAHWSYSLHALMHGSMGPQFLGPESVVRMTPAVFQYPCWTGAKVLSRSIQAWLRVQAADLRWINLFVTLDHLVCCYRQTKVGHTYSGTERLERPARLFNFFNLI